MEIPRPKAGILTNGDDADNEPKGIICENITTEGLDVNALEIGERLRAGEVELELSAVCEPCELMEELKGRRGMLCRVLRGGVTRPGDRIELKGRSSEDVRVLVRME